MSDTSTTTPPTAAAMADGAASAPTPRIGRGGAPARRWWARIADHQRGDPGTMAELRRCRATSEAARVREAITLARMLGACEADAPAWRTAAALDLARVLAHVRSDTGVHPMRAAGWGSFAGTRRESDLGAGERPRLSEVRFRRLLQTADGEERVTAFTRLIALLDGAVGVAHLAADFLRWTHPTDGDRVREHWAFLYYHAADAAPPLPPDDDLSTTDDFEDDAA